MSTRSGGELAYIRAVNLALEAVLEESPEVVIFGEDVGIPDGPFGATKGLAKKFGADRVFDTPISESAMIGTALGAAMGGLRPIVEVMFADFLYVAMDQIVNQVANSRYVSKGKLTAPLVIRTQQGSTPGSCAQHSQSVEAILAHIPGLRVVLPSTPQDAYSCLRLAVASDDPTIVIESRRLYPTKGMVDLSLPLILAEGAQVVRTGTDATVVCWGAMVPSALDQAADLEERGLSVEVVDLRWAAPLDIETVVASVRKTGHVVVAHEAVRTCGLGAEVVTRIYEQLGPGAFVHARIGAEDAPIPAARSLSRHVLPTDDGIAAAVDNMFSGVRTRS